MKIPAKYNNELNLLRTDIWRIASDYKLSEEELVDELISVIGKKIDCSRVCYYIRQPKNRTQSDLLCTQEWLNEGISPTKGLIIPASLGEQFKEMHSIEITKERALEFISPIIHPIIEPLIRNLIEEQNLYSMTVFPFYINEEIKGLFTLDICIDAIYKPQISAEITEIMIDMMKIVAIQKEKQIMESDLKKAYQEMEKKVEDRTAEIRQKNDELQLKEELILEKNRTLETSLEILSHDTKNIFFNISILINEITEKKQRILLKENIDELYEMTMESAGILKSRKRIYDLIELVESIRLTSARIPLSQYRRIELKHCCRYNLFIETSALFKNALSNLIENALKYSPEDSTVTIEISAENEEINIAVIDKGSGISDSDKNRIFEKYYRVEKDTNKEGSGRGLWITRNIIEKDNGKLSVKDNPKGGSIFNLNIIAHRTKNLEDSMIQLTKWFNLSLNEVKQKFDSIKTLFEINNEEVIHYPSAVFNTLLSELRVNNKIKKKSSIRRDLSNLLNQNPDGKKVLIVDDSLYVHSFIAKILNQYGYNVIGFAFDGEEGEEKYKKLRPDLITLDNTMPLKSGLEVAKSLIEFNPDIKIIVISAVADLKTFRDEIEKRIPEKNIAIINKPISAELLMENVSALMELELI